MATWRELSEDSLKASEALLREGRYRSSVSRAYYSAYCAPTHEIVQRLTTFAFGWNNPPHEKSPIYVQNNLTLPPSGKNKIKRLLRILRQYREDADYRPHRSINVQAARDCVRDAVAIQQAPSSPSVVGSSAKGLGDGCAREAGPRLTPQRYHYGINTASTEGR